MQRSMLCALLVAAILLLPGCGGAERERIARVLTTGLTSTDPRDVCEGALSPALLARIYGSTERCHQVESETSERVSRAKSVAVEHVRTQGSRATAEVEISGGNRDGARGTLSLVRSAGDWRVSDLSVGLLRSQFEAGLRQATAIDAGARMCIARKMRALDDAAFKQLAFGSSNRSQRRLGTIAQRCERQIAQVARQAV